MQKFRNETLQAKISDLTATSSSKFQKNYLLVTRSNLKYTDIGELGILFLGIWLPRHERSVADVSFFLHARNVLLSVRQNGRLYQRGLFLVCKELDSNLEFCPRLV